jgi:hypothetical protein
MRRSRWATKTHEIERKKYVQSDKPAWKPEGSSTTPWPWLNAVVACDAALRASLTSPRCRGITVFTFWRNAYCLTRVSWRFADRDGYWSKEPVNVSIAPSSHTLRAAISYLETARPSSLHGSIMWLSCKFGPLIRGIGSCTLRAQWTSTRSARTHSNACWQISRSWIALPLSFFLNNRTSPGKPVRATSAY